MNNSPCEKSNYTILNEHSVIDYAVDNLGFFTSKNSIECKEIGDGNLNNVYHLIDKTNHKSLIIKQALPYARTSIEMKLSAKRCRIEANALMKQGLYAPDMVPKVYNYNDDLCILSMEDLSSYQVLRTGMIQQIQYPTLANDAARFFALTLIKSSDIVLSSKEKKAQVALFNNPDLCELTEMLVLTNATYPAQRNKIAPESANFVHSYIFADEDIRTRCAELKHRFMTCAEALLHGDAHTGSVFARQSNIKFFDTEFAFYGPMGFDVGMFCANLIMNACYHQANQHIDYLDYTIDTVEQFIDLFQQHFLSTWEKYATEHFAKIDQKFKSNYLSIVLKDIAGYCACEMIRRTTGSSHVKEMDDYSSPELRYQAQHNNLMMAILLLKYANTFKKGSDYSALLRRTLT